MFNKTKAISYDNKVRSFWLLVGISILSLVVYIYAINSTARNIAVIQDLERETREMSADINSLEFAYIDLKNNITIELAHNYGFHEARTPLYVSRTPVALTFNTAN